MDKKKNLLWIIIGMLWSIVLAIGNSFFEFMKFISNEFVGLFIIIGPFLISFGIVNYTNLNRALKIILAIILTIIISVLYWFILWAMSGFAI